MVGGLIDLVTGGVEQKKRWRQYKARVNALPPAYRTAVEALERYLMHFGPEGAEDMQTMYDHLADLFEGSAASGTSVREVVGENPVEFAEAFMLNFPAGRWISRERERLTGAIDAIN